MKRLTKLLTCGLKITLIFLLLNPILNAHHIFAAEEKSVVVTSQETISPQKSNIELYQQYHLLIIASLEEAANTLSEDQVWAYRMTHNAYSYLQLLLPLLLEEQQDKLLEIAQELNQLIRSLKKDNLTDFKKEKIKDKLKQISAVLQKKFLYEEVRDWIKK